jgi:hypothetical protein
VDNSVKATLSAAGAALAVSACCGWAGLDGIRHPEHHLQPSDAQASRLDLAFGVVMLVVAIALVLFSVFLGRATTRIALQEAENERRLHERRRAEGWMLCGACRGTQSIGTTKVESGSIFAGPGQQQYKIEYRPVPCNNPRCQLGWVHPDPRAVLPRQPFAAAGTYVDAMAMAPANASDDRVATPVANPALAGRRTSAVDANTATVRTARSSAWVPASVGARERGIRWLWYEVPRRLFAARNSFLGEVDTVTARLSAVRSIVATVAVIYLGLLGPDLSLMNPISGVVSQAGPLLNSEVYSLGAALAVSVIAAVGIIAWAQRGYRWNTARAMLIPLRTVAVFVALVGSVVGALAGLNYWSGPWTTNEHAGRHLIALGLILVVFFLGANWIARGFYYCLTGLFRADDGHPLLAPIAGPAAAWILALINGGDSPLPGPEYVAIGARWAGPISVTVISVIHVHRLAVRYVDFPFRRGPVA